MKRHYFPAIIGATLVLLGASTCANLPIDQSAQAAASNDETIIFQGAGAKSQKGYLFIQKREGTPITETISLITPKLTCKGTNCARYQFFRKDGTPGLAGGIPRGNTSTPISIADLVGHSGATTSGDDGEYSGVIQMFYLDSTGHEYSTVMNGFIRLNVLSTGYDPVGCNDPAIGWHVKTAPSPTPCDVQFTTAGRAVTCGSGCAQ